MGIRTKSVMWGLAVAVLLAGNLQLAFAHRWNSWHFNHRSVGTYVFGSYQTEANAALNDWAGNTAVSFPRKNSHTDISVLGDNYGDTGWSGLASIIEVSWDWWCWGYCGTYHGHARYNTYYNSSSCCNSSANRQGIFCQEIGHLFGLGHSDNGCMGKTYYNNLNNVSSHNASDMNAYTGTLGAAVPHSH